LYHARGWWDNRPQGEIKRLIAAIGEAEWRDICPWDDGTALAEFQRETLNPRIWGGAVQIAAMARIRGVAILVHTDFGLQVFGRGPAWQLKHRGNPGHFDVVEPDPVRGEGSSNQRSEEAGDEEQTRGARRGVRSSESEKAARAPADRWKDYNSNKGNATSSQHRDFHKDDTPYDAKGGRAGSRSERANSLRPPRQPQCGDFQRGTPQDVAARETVRENEQLQHPHR